MSPLGPVQTPNFSWAELNSYLDRPKLTKVRLLIQTPYFLAVPNSIPIKPVKIVSSFQEKQINMADAATLHIRRPKSMFILRAMLKKAVIRRKNF